MNNGDDDDDDDINDGYVFFFFINIFCKNLVFEAPLWWLEVVSNFCSTFSWYERSRPADIETGPQLFITSCSIVQIGREEGECL